MQHQNNNQPETPSAPPVAARESSGQEAQFIPNGRAVPMRNVFAWIADAWGLFKQQTGLWTKFMLVFVALPTVPVVLFILLQGTPFFSIAVLFIIMAMFMEILLVAGASYFCDVLRREGAFTFNDFFVAFNRDSGPLLIIYMVGIGFFIVQVCIHIILSVHNIVTILTILPLAVTGSMIFVGKDIIIFVWEVICGMALWFTPALIMLHNIPPFKAIRMSFSACLKNILPIGIFFLLMKITEAFLTLFLRAGDHTDSAISMVSYLPSLLIAILMACFIFVCTYTAYRDIFFAEEH